MALRTALLTSLLISLLLSHIATAVRLFSDDPKSKLDLATRLQGETNDCWTALGEIRQCSNEIIAFFLNGQTDIDEPCCNAIEYIMRQCWPSMLGILGFTAQEGSLLAGYCNKAAHGPASAPLTTTNVFVDTDHV